MAKLHDIGWDDLQVDVSGAKVPPSNAPTWRDWAHGIVAGITFPVLGFAVNDYVYFSFQSRHSMKLSTELDTHIHFSTPTDGSATPDKFKFQVDVIAAPIDGSWVVPTGSPFTAEHTITADYSNQHKLFDVADIPAINTTVSSIWKCKLTRIAASADEYSGEVYMHFIDSHYQIDSLGSENEGSK